MQPRRVAQHAHDLQRAVGTGCTMSAMQTIATRNVPPRALRAAIVVPVTALLLGAGLGLAVKRPAPREEEAGQAPADIARSHN